MFKSVKTLVVSLFLLWVLVACSLNSTPTVSPITDNGKTLSYSVRIQSETTGEYIPNARVTLDVKGKAPLDELTDTYGFARIFIGPGYIDQPGVLTVQAAGFCKHTQYIDLNESLPDVISLKESSSGIVTQTPTSTLTLPTNTPPHLVLPSPTFVSSIVTPTVVLPTDTPLSPTNTSIPILPNSTPTVVLPTGTPTSSLPSPTPLPTPIPVQKADFSGQLAIPVMYGMQHKIYITGLDGEGVNGSNPVSLIGMQPMLCHNTQLIVVNGTEANDSGVYIADIKTKNLKTVIDRDSAYWPVSNDGEEVVFVETSTGGKLSKRNANSDISEVWLNNYPVLAKNVFLSNDNRIVFQSCANWAGKPGECGTWISDINNINPIRIIGNDDLIPKDVKNGKITFISNKDGDWEVYLLSLQSGNLEKITDNKNQDGLPAIAPDGKSVAYISDASGKWALWTVELDNKQQKQWFNIDPQHGTVDVNSWFEERMSWSR